jgi:hypothetical protein
MSYKFAIPDNTIAQRSEDNAFIPWNVAEGCPLDTGGYVYRQWVADGSPQPAPYEPPPGPTRWLVPKSLIISRVTDQQLTQMESNMSGREGAMWRAADITAIWNDDARMREVLIGCGADPDAVLAPPPP